MTRLSNADKFIVIKHNNLNRLQHDQFPIILRQKKMKLPWNHTINYVHRWMFDSSLRRQNSLILQLLIKGFLERMAIVNKLNCFLLNRIVFFLFVSGSFFIWTRAVLLLTDEKGGWRVDPYEFLYFYIFVRAWFITY